MTKQIVVRRSIDFEKLFDFLGSSRNLDNYGNRLTLDDFRDFDLTYDSQNVSRQDLLRIADGIQEKSNVPTSDVIAYVEILRIVLLHTTEYVAQERGL